MSDDALLDLLLELQALDRLPRTGYSLRGVADPESVSEHTFHVAFLAWALAERIPAVDPGRAVELALVHDLAEVRLGDLPMISARHWPAGAKKRAEAGVTGELLAPLGERAARLAAEFAAGESAEARLVKACDKLQLMLKVSAYEGWGAGGLDEFWDNPDNFPDGGYDVVRRLYDALRRRRGG